MSEMPKEIWACHELPAWESEQRRPQMVRYTRADICDPTNLLKLNAEQGEIIRGLVKELHAAEITFRHYADLHRAKGTDDGRVKAESNEQHANRISTAIAKFRRG